MLTYERAYELLKYDPDTGVITRRKTAGKVRAGQVAGSLKQHGYLSFDVEGERYYAHRVAWLLGYGEWPAGQIDHIDQNRSNNALYNLREATHAQNRQNASVRPNNKSGTPGVCWNKYHRKWEAKIGFSKRYTWLGYFNDLNSAIGARRIAEIKYHGEFSPLHQRYNSEAL